MSEIIVEVIDIKKEQILNLVKFDFHGITLEMMSLELNEKIKVGCKVSLNIKSTHTVLAKDFQGLLSNTNKIQAKVIEIEKGKLLSCIKLQRHDTIFESLITSEYLEVMDIKKDENLCILIRPSDISIKEILND